MLPYIIFYIFIFIVSFKIQPKKYNIFDYLLIIAIVLFSGLRLNVGTDYGLYETIYNNISLSSALESRTGVGFSVLMQLFKNILHLSYPFFIFFVSALTNIFLYVYLKKNSKKPGRTLLLYISFGLYGFTFNGFRQGMSIVLMLYGLMYLQNNKKIVAIVWYLLSFLCHSSSIAGIVLSFFFEKNAKIKLKLTYIVPIFMIVFLNYDYIYSLFLGNVSSYKMYLDTFNQYLAGLGTYLNTFVFLTFYFVFVWNKITEQDNNQYNKSDLLYYNLSTIGIFIMILGIKNWLFVRFSYQFIIFYIFLIDSYYEKKNIKNNKIISLSFYLFMFLYFLMNTYFFNGLVPYRSVI